MAQYQLAATTRVPARDYDGYFFDLDGTVYLGDEPLPGAADTIAALRQAGKMVAFLSNNPTKTPQQYADKLTGMGIATLAGDVITTIETTVRWLHGNYPQAVVYPIAEAPLCRALTDAGFAISDDAKRVDVVIASYDRGFTYAKLQVAFDALRRPSPAILIQTNPDPYCPFPDDAGQPDAGAITAAIEACAQVRCVANMGKPSPLLLEAALSRHGLLATNCLMVGDRLSTDIAMAQYAGMDAAVVFTGQTKPSDLTEQYADVYRLNQLCDLLPTA